MLQLKDFMPVNFLKKEKYTGSCKGMRFRMEKFEKEGADAPILRVSVWPEPYSFDCTPEEEKEFLEICKFEINKIQEEIKEKERILSRYGLAIEKLKNTENLVKMLD